MALTSATAILALLNPGSVVAATTPQPTVTVTSVTASQVKVGTSVKLGGRLTVNGVGLGNRRVQLQLKTPTGMPSLAETTTTSEGFFSVSVPTFWYGAHSFRVTALGGGSYATSYASRLYAVTVVPTYTPTGSPTGYALMDGRWNPCGTVPYYVNTGNGAPSNALSAVSGALALVTQATGIRFAYRGYTSKVPSQSGDTDGTFVTNALTIAWATPPQVGDFSNKYLYGYGGPRQGFYYDGTAKQGDGAGTVTLNSNNGTMPYLSSADQNRLWRAILLHEVGHAFGMAHSSDNTEVMWPHSSPQRSLYQAGDLAGLSRLGLNQGCIAP